jgi:hypothetical protein
MGELSTLINNIAQWLQIDAFTLLIALAAAVMTLHARKITAQYFIILKGNLSLKSFFQSIQKIYFVYLKKKQSSKTAIANYQIKNENINKSIDATK